MRGATSFVQVEFPQSVAGRTESSGSDLLVQAGAVQLSQGAAVSVRLLSTDSDGLSRKLTPNNERKKLYVGVDDDAERV